MRSLMLVQRRLAEMEVLDTNDHLNAVAMDKKRLAMEAQMLAEVWIFIGFYWFSLV